MKDRFGPGRIRPGYAERVRRIAALALLLSALAAAPSAHAGQLPAGWQKGLNVTGFWWSDFQGPSFKRWLSLAKTSAHANQVTFVVSWYQYFSSKSRTDELNANEIHDSPGTARRCKGKNGKDYTSCKTPSIGSLRKAIRRAKAMGLKVWLRPQVDVGRGDPTSTARKYIDKSPAERAAWFQSYKFFLSQYVRVARDEHVDGLLIGAGFSALTNTDDDRAVWRQLIADVRSGALTGDGRGYTGKLGYAAEWDSVVQDAGDPATQLFFWDALDVIGIDAYFPLVPKGEQGNPSPDILRAGWSTDFQGGLPDSPLDLVRKLHAEYDKPVVFTGLGYLSRQGTAAYPEKSELALASAGGRVSQRAQERPIRAAFDVWSNIARTEHWFQGIWWWEWPASGRGGPKNGSFSVEGKLAEQTICSRQGGRSCHPTKRVP